MNAAAASTSTTHARTKSSTAVLRAHAEKRAITRFAASATANAWNTIEVITSSVSRTEIGARDDARKIIEPDKQPGQNGDKARRKQHKEEFDETERLMRGKQQHDERHDAKRERNDRRIERDIGIGIIEYIRKPQARIEQREDVEQNRQKQERRFEQIEFCRGAVALEDRNDGADEQHRICRDDQQQG